jgi:hypothetical protein
MSASSSTVRVQRRNGGLVQLAAAARARRCRQRHRDGQAVVPVEIDIEPVTEYLVDAGLLQLGQVQVGASWCGSFYLTCMSGLREDSQRRSCLCLIHM